MFARKPQSHPKTAWGISNALEFRLQRRQYAMSKTNSPRERSMYRNLRKLSGGHAHKIIAGYGPTNVTTQDGGALFFERSLPNRLFNIDLQVSLYDSATLTEL